MHTTRVVLRNALLHQPVEAPPYDFERMRALLDSPTVRLTIYEIESSVMLWVSFIPSTPQARAAILYAISRKYLLSHEAAPQTCQVLAADDPDVQAAFLALSGQVLDDLLAVHAPLDERPFWFRLKGITEPQAVKDLQDSLDWIYVPSGEVLFREGERGNSMCVVVTGRLRVVVAGADGEEILVELGRGSVVGELAALSQEGRRTATVYAIRDSELICLTGDGLEQLAMKHPQIGFAIMREVVSKLRKNTLLPRSSSQLATIAVVASRPDLPLRRFTEQLSAAFGAKDTVYLLDSKAFDAELGQGACTLPESDSRNGDLIAWLTALELANRFVILEADTTMTEWTRRCLRTADRVLILTDATQSPEPGQLEMQISELLGKKLVAQTELVMLQPARTIPPVNTRLWLNARDAKRHHHLCLDNEADIQKLARFISGRAVGLVLSGGGARGMAHAGAVRALEEAGFQVDAVGGTSFGSIMAAMVALEWGWEKMYAELRDFAATHRKYFRYTLPTIAFMEGQPINEFFRNLYEREFIEDLWVDYFCVATNMSVGRQVVLDTGSLWRSVRASLSIPGVFPPVPFEGNLLVDGGLLNNLPVDIMRSRLGNGTIIASYIDTDDSSPKAYTYDDAVSPWDQVRSRINPLRERVAVPTIVDTITRSIGLSNRSAIPAQKAGADLLIEHSVSQYGLFQYDAIEEVLNVGYESARRAIAVWEAGDENN
jgi:predicted acylesterase/phospholipase RssA/CRP-like cAMP-binding protein